MKNIIIAIAALAALTGPALAQEAGSLDDLLRRVERGSASDQSELNSKVAAFRQNSGQQAALRQQAEAEKAAEEQRSDTLETTFEENERQIIEVQAQLDERLGSLKELYGVLQQVAGETQGQLNNSITSVQYPDRGEFLDNLVKKLDISSKLASIEEIERLWFELQREATLQGKVEKFNTTVITADGQEREMPVARVGVFNIIGDGTYLRYTPETGNVSELPRQPPQGRFTASAADVLAAAPNEPVDFAIDPTRGGLLDALITSPTLIERIKQGGTVGYVIIGLGLFGLLIALERFLVLSVTSGRVSSQLKDSTPNTNNPLGRVLKTADDNKGQDMETLELRLSEAILQETPALNRALGLLKIISVVAPLLGLLGTVTGMIQTFQQITLFGTGDPKLMAGGISLALVTTVLGLCVAIPMVLLHTLVSSRSRRITHVLQEQAAGIIAQRSERGA